MTYDKITKTLEAISQMGTSVKTKFDNLSFTSGLSDTPTGYLGHSGDYLVVNDGESGIHFTGIEKIAQDLTDYGFGGGSADIPKYTNLPDPTENDGKIVASGCDLYYGCDGEWKKIGADSIPPPENIPGCISNLEEYNQYQEYKERFLAENSSQSFDQMLNFNNDITDLIYDVCLFSDSDLSSVKIDETTYKWGMFANTQTVNITATPGVASDREIQFSHWAGDGAVFGDANSSQTTLLVDKDLSITGYFSEILEVTCEDVALHIQSDTTTVNELSSNNHSVVLQNGANISSVGQLFNQNVINLPNKTSFEMSNISNNYMSGTKDFTFETWFKTATPGTGSEMEQQIIKHHDPSNLRKAATLTYRGNISSTSIGQTSFRRFFNFVVNEGSGSTNVIRVHLGFYSTFDLLDNTWYHVALVRRNVSEWNMYINGQKAIMSTKHFDGNTYASVNGSIAEYVGNVGCYNEATNTAVNFNIQDWRFSKTAVYTDDFNPPNSLLNNPCPIQPACEGVALHIQSDTTDGDVTFVDRSSNTHDITVVGDTQHSTTDAYLGTTSMSFDGVGDYLQVGDTTTFKFLHDASTDYTIEGWFYIDSSIPTSNITHRIMGHVINSSRDVGIDFFVREDTPGVISYNIHRGEILTVHRGVSTQASAFVEDQWNHVAVVYTINNQPKIYLNGQDTQAVPITNYSNNLSASTSNSADRLTIGAFGPGGAGEANWWPGYMQDLRITKKAIYTTNFTPPNSLLNNPC